MMLEQEKPLSHLLLLGLVSSSLSLQTHMTKRDMSPTAVHPPAQLVAEGPSSGPDAEWTLPIFLCLTCARLSSWQKRHRVVLEKETGLATGRFLVSHQLPFILWVFAATVMVPKAGHLEAKADSVGALPDLR